MLRILINSYACCPGMGSEQGMGWNWILAIAKHCECHIITEGEYRLQIEAWMNNAANSELASRMRFYYNEVSPEVRRRCWNQGDWRFYLSYRHWQRKTAHMAKEIIRRQHVKGEDIDVIHQLNMIGFREPGYLASVSKHAGIPLVWGPIGGMKQFPMAYANGWKVRLFHSVKNSVNVMQMALYPRVRKTMTQSSVLISSISDSYKAIKKYYGRESVLIPETGFYTDDMDDKVITRSRFTGETLNVIWVGKFSYRKRLDIALNAIIETNNPNIKMKIYGTGNDRQVADTRKFLKNNGLEDRVEMMGQVSAHDVHKAMLESDVFMFTSVDEDTSTVVLEAICAGLPVVCFDTCGMASVVCDNVGRKIPLTNPRQSVRHFAAELNRLYKNRSELDKYSHNCRAKAIELSWEMKSEKIFSLYEETVRKCKPEELREVPIFRGGVNVLNHMMT
ncbi:MAG: glycosyltransferase [Bacteroidales bacterium]|nr:glycosyltransferase [Bacteroidales bacterium]MCM1205824.1 glycosyltransferase [Bacillota bacterium]MCM1509932.1 glycosyltransferase [Clostridium sp.]